MQFSLTKSAMNLNLRKRQANKKHGTHKKRDEKSMQKPRKIIGIYRNCKKRSEDGIILFFSLVKFVRVKSRGMFCFDGVLSLKRFWSF